MSQKAYVEVLSALTSTMKKGYVGTKFVRQAILNAKSHDGGAEGGGM